MYLGKHIGDKMAVHEFRVELWWLYKIRVSDLLTRAWSKKAGLLAKRYDARDPVVTKDTYV